MLIFQVKSEIVHCLIYNVCDDTVDGRNPAPVDMVDYPMIYMVLYIPGGAGCLPSRVLFQDELDDHRSNSPKKKPKFSAEHQELQAASVDPQQLEQQAV